MATREEDVQKLIDTVFNTTPEQMYPENSWDYTQCPFCGKTVDYLTNNMSIIKHDFECAWLIAKDLNTGSGL